MDVTQPAACLSDRAGPRRGPADRGHRRQPVPRLRRRHRGQLDRPRHPQVVAAIKEQAAELIHFSASDFYLPIYAEVCRELARIAPIAAARSGPISATPGTEVVEAAIKLARHATKRPYVVAFLGAFHGRTYGSVSPDRLEGEVPRRVRAAAAGRLPRALSAGSRTCAGSTRSCSTSSRRPTRSRRSSSSRSRARAATSSPRTASSQGLREICDRARHPADRRRDPVRRRPHRADVGGRALGRRARHPADGQGHRLGHAARRDGRPGRAARDLGSRRPRLDVRRQPGRLRGRARDDRAARGRPHRQRRGPRRRRHSPASAELRRRFPAWSPMSAARA